MIMELRGDITKNNCNSWQELQSRMWELYSYNPMLALMLQAQAQFRSNIFFSWNIVFVSIVNITSWDCTGPSSAQTGTRTETLFCLIKN